ncbi:MAG: hypothetical protein J0H68_08130 [Sphingobacteriia bacterium]|nr:hypothetical protein [Sphingobacteriia bacterium]
MLASTEKKPVIVPNNFSFFTKKLDKGFLNNFIFEPIISFKISQEKNFLKFLRNAFRYMNLLEHSVKISVKINALNEQEISNLGDADIGGEEPNKFLQSVFSDTLINEIKTICKNNNVKYGSVMKLFNLASHYYLKARSCAFKDDSKEAVNCNKKSIHVLAIIFNFLLNGRDKDFIIDENSTLESLTKYFSDSISVMEGILIINDIYRLPVDIKIDKKTRSSFNEVIFLIEQKYGKEGVEELKRFFESSNAEYLDYNKTILPLNIKEEIIEGIVLKRFNEIVQTLSSPGKKGGGTLEWYKNMQLNKVGFANRKDYYEDYIKNSPAPKERTNDRETGIYNEHVISNVREERDKEQTALLDGNTKFYNSHSK